MKIGPAHPLAISIIVATIIWMALYHIVMRRLRSDHLPIIEKMSSLDGVRFILMRKHKNLDDPRLSKLSDLALAYFVPYLAFFAYVYLTHGNGAA